MRLATIAHDGGSAVAVVGDDGRVRVLLTPGGDVAWRELGELIRSDVGLDGARPLAAAALDRDLGVAVDDTRFLVPIAQPDHVLCVAANYRAHIEETGTITYAAETESSPWFFTKPQSSLNPHRSPIVLPARYGTKVDWEAELAVVIGTGGGSIPEDQAWKHVAGYTVVNDVSARAMDVPERTTVRDRDGFHDWLHGKWFDTFCCIGPWVVTADAVPNPADIRVSLTLNGEVWQDASTALMIYPIPRLIAFVSSIVTLRPGDVIATGTPSGVGKSKGRFLAPGDVVAASVEGVGTLTNPVAGGGDGLG
jgi:2-keto-4-pentenoate hydratase/2-oxohepta-3-ene-1,7-dioic acid hydratase in catechol pathway